MEARTARTIEELRSRLGDLEARQRAAGGVADSAWAAGSESVDAAEPSGPAGAALMGGSTGSRATGAGSDFSPDEHVRSPESPLATGVDADGVVWENVDARLSASLDVAAQIARSWQAPLAFCRETDLLDTVSVLGHLRQARDLILLRVVTELEARGVASPGGLSRVDWLRAVDPSLTAAAARAVVTVASAAAAAAGHDPSAFEDAATTARRAVRESLLSRVGDGALPVDNAAQILELGDRLQSVADPGELTQAMQHLTEEAGSLRAEELARACRQHADELRPPRDLDDLDDARRGARGLWFSQPNKTGMVNLKAILDPESAAIVKGAIDPLAAPRPLRDEDTRAVTEPDPRPAHQRRLDALVEIVGRGVAAPDGQQTTDKAKIVVTIDYDTLADKLADSPTNTDGQQTTTDTDTGTGTGTGTDIHTRAGADALATGAAATGRPGTGCGVSGTGDILSPATVRRLACDASLIAAVLGGQGEPLDVARHHRLVTPAIRTALVLRDTRCSFPGCTVPAAWTDAHHLTHWIDGGTTSLHNLALLCRRHHTYVHRHGLTATVTATGVTWHTWQQWRRGAPCRGPTDPTPETSDGHHDDARVIVWDPRDDPDEDPNCTPVAAARPERPRARAVGRVI